MMVKFILASKSPRRTQLLSELGYEFEAVSADIDETPLKAEKPRDYVKRVAVGKALKVAESRPDANIISADTVCAMGRRLLGQPADKQQAFDYIKMLSGASHRVYTCVVARLANGEIKTKIVETRVKFRPMSKADIQAYVDTEDNWKGKAGGFGIQTTKGSSLVKSIVGSPSSVIGLPLYETECLLKHFK